MKGKLTILLSGMIAGDPWQGGATWAVLQYWLGLRRLGHEVYFVEPIAESSLRPVESSVGNALCGVSEWREDFHPPSAERHEHSLQNSANATYFKQVTARFGLADCGALLSERQTIGIAYDYLLAIARRADLLINISGMLTDAALVDHIPRRVYLDLDPAFNQLWHDVQKIDMRFDGHTHFATIGLAIGAPGCPVPSCGHEWIKTFQPIVLEHWPFADGIVHNALTTVGHWRGYGSIEHEGIFYGQKAHSLRRFIELPTRTSERFMLALAIHGDEERDLSALSTNGWALLDPAKVASTPDDYRSFLQGSKAEFGIAKSGYVASRCGWFSDRSVCYLASGRPVVAQETGFSRFLPVGEGLLAFDSVEGAVAAVDAMNADYSRHARAARAIAEEYFESDRVLGRLIEQVTS